MFLGIAALQCTLLPLIKWGCEDKFSCAFSADGTVMNPKPRDCSIILVKIFTCCFIDYDNTIEDIAVLTEIC